MTKARRCGFVAIIGRPNVGKSSLLNRFLEKKLSITSRRPQTTRHQILGVMTREETQWVFVDTPGIQFEKKSALNRYMNKKALGVLEGVDVLLWVVEALAFEKADEAVLECLKHTTLPVFLLVNKVDKIQDKTVLLPFLSKLSEKHTFEGIFPVSARRGTNLSEVIEKISTLLPEQDFFFPENVRTDRSTSFLISEIIREKLMRSLGQELPYTTAVTLEVIEEKDKIVHVHSIVWVERDTQKAIVIGEKGVRLKQISTDAREDIESLLEKHVFLRIWVRVRSHWTDDESALPELGYDGSV